MNEFNVNSYQIDGDSITGGFSIVAEGRYNAKVLDVIPLMSKGGPGKVSKPMLRVIYQITGGAPTNPDDGTQVGMDIVQHYMLSVTPPKKAGQRGFSPGLVEIRDIARAVGGTPIPLYGVPYADGLPAPDEDAAIAVAKKMRQVFGKVVQQKTLDIAVWHKTSTSDTAVDAQGKPLVRKDVHLKVLGAVGGASTASSESLDDDIV
jgi:hypothetical protein